MTLVASELRQELLANADVFNIVLRRDEMRELVLASPMPHAVDLVVDLRETTAWSLAHGAFDTLMNGGDRVILVMGEPVKGGGVLIEATMAEGPLKAAMIDYGKTHLFLVVWVVIGNRGDVIFCNPTIDWIADQSGGASNPKISNPPPEDSRQIIEPKAGVTEFYKAEVALAEMETELNASLLERKRLVALGGAVSKISHDLRNILTTTQLLADSMEMSKDPRVQRIAPKLVNSLSRAVNLCERTLSFGKAEEADPIHASFAAHQLIDDVVEAERLAIGEANVKIAMKVPPKMMLWADQEQLFRVISNLTRNARQVLVAGKKGGDIIISASEGDGNSVITIQDTGPGLPPKARENMFKPFEGSARAGGTGLGLAISAELIANHNGTLEMTDSTDQGTTFQITLPMP